MYTDIKFQYVHQYLIKLSYLHHFLCTAISSFLLLQDKHTLGLNIYLNFHKGWQAILYSYL